MIFRKINYGDCRKLFIQFICQKCLSSILTIKLETMLLITEFIINVMVGNVGNTIVDDLNSLIR